MRPVARLAAAIEVLSAWATSPVPLDGVLAEWGRAHRFAGSKDRAAIADRVYAVLRRRGECGAALQADTPRGWVLGSLAVEDGMDADAIAALLASAPHAPAPLSDGERAALRTGAPRELPAHVAGNYPEALQEELARSLGAGLADEMAAMGARAPLDLRVNRLKATRDAARSALAVEGIGTIPLVILPDALRCAPNTPVQRTRAYADGLVEIQDAGAQIAARLACAEPGETVIDLAAGAGGKTLALAAEMGNRGRLIATDIDPKRLARLVPRAERAGATMITVHPAGVPLDSGLAADCVVLDVPCTGSGTWRRHPDRKWRFKPEALRALTKTQAGLLDEGAGRVRPGGRLVYITCSLLAVENEDAVQAFLTRNREFCLRPRARSLAEAGLRAISCRDDGLGVSLTPASSETDGFFIAVLERVGTSGHHRTDKGPA